VPFCLVLLIVCAESHVCLRETALIVRCFWLRASDLERIMANPIFAKKADKSLAKAIKTAMKDGALSASELRDLMVAVLDPATKKTVLPSVDDVEYRDLRRFMRKEKRLTTFDRLALEAFLDLSTP
jgi:hypothetical protein